jgi:hypothetical protein
MPTVEPSGRIFGAMVKKRMRDMPGYRLAVEGLALMEQADQSK